MPIGTLIGARYEALEELGHGGSGIVYRARDAQLARDVEIKLLHQELSEAVSADRFLRAIALTARLDHRYSLSVPGLRTMGRRSTMSCPLSRGSVGESIDTGALSSS